MNETIDTNIQRKVDTIVPGHHLTLEELYDNRDELVYYDSVNDMEDLIYHKGVAWISDRKAREVFEDPMNKLVKNRLKS